ncbi:MAG: hypothetical protein QGH06_07995 [Lutibacter sp.]|nr:hypothetical protein [Lutibacter sp.]
MMIQSALKIAFCIVLFLLNMAFSYGQSDQSLDTEKAVLTFTVKTDDIEELKNLDWNRIEELFQGNEKGQEISLSFVYENTDDKPTIRVNNFEITISNQTEDLPGMIAQSKKLIDRLYAWQKQYKEVGINNPEG